MRDVLALLVAAILAVAAPAHASDLGTPTGPVILTVTSDGHSWDFDREMLAALGWESITTDTPFTEGPQDFSGVPLAALVEATGATGTTVDAVALNDYRVEIPMEHLTRHDILLALDHNGEAMRIRDRGPIWIIYPDGPERETQRYDSYMVWQLRELAIR